MWKKESAPVYTPPAQGEAHPDPERNAPARQDPERAAIGRSITIQGEVTGDEDLLIQGRVDGTVDLKQHAVTVGTEGDVRASVVGRAVIVEGTVDGNIRAEEQVILRSSACVHGDISSPRVVLEDGARFRGGVDMGGTAASDKSTSRADSGQTRPAIAVGTVQAVKDTSPEKTSAA